MGRVFLLLDHVLLLTEFEVSVVRVQKGWKASQRLSNGTFIRSIWLAIPGEGTGSNSISWIGSHQRSASPELNSLQSTGAPWMVFVKSAKTYTDKGQKLKFRRNLIFGTFIYLKSIWPVTYCFKPYDLFDSLKLTWFFSLPKIYVLDVLSF